MTERAAILKLIGDRVRVRFTVLDAIAFADYVVQKARETPSLDRPLVEHLASLSLDDLYLAAACSMNHDEAWEELGAAHFSFMRQFARRFLREPAAADVADHVIADLWQRGKITRYSGRSSLRTWLGAILSHAAINAAKSTHIIGLVRHDSSPDAARVFAAQRSLEYERESSRLLAKLIVEVLHDLTPDDKLLLLMHYEQGLTLDAMGRAIGGSRATLSRRLRDARERLWASLDALARRRVGAPAESLKDGLDLARLDFDLESAVGAVRSVDERRKDIV